MTDYPSLLAALGSLIDQVPHPTSNLANAAALLYHSLPDLNWAGFYLSEGELLILGPFQGRPACIEIPYGKGVCGTAAAGDRTVVVDNVHEFPGHIACDGASIAEIVIPLHCSGKVAGVMDLDSPLFRRFSEEDRSGLEQFAAIVERAVFR